MARITPSISTLADCAVNSEKALNTTAGSGSFGCSRITTGVDITCAKSGNCTSGRALPFHFGSSGPCGVGNGHHQACTGGSKAPCGMKMQAGSAALHCGTAGRHWPFAQKKSDAQVTFAQADGCCAVCGTEQVPSGWQ